MRRAIPIRTPTMPSQPGRTVVEMIDAATSSVHRPVNK
jgi:hypothetical protein